MTSTHADLRVRLTALTVAALLAGCRDVDPVRPVPITAEPAAVAQRVAYISVSDLAPETGGTIVVGAVVGVGDSLSLASFRVRLSYDRDALHFVDEVELPGMMRVVNPRPGEVIVAGASSGDASDGRLFALRFRVNDATGLQSLALHVDELNDREFVSRVSMLKRSERLRLDRKLAPAR